MNSTIYIYMLMWVVCLYSCTDLTETYKDFQGDGEISYTGKVDSIIFREGLNKVQLEGFLYYTRTAKELVISWNDERKVVDIENLPKNKKIEVLIDDLEEGIYLFKVYTLDKDQNRSIVTTVQANVYGDSFIEAQNQVPYSITNTERNTVEIDWGDIPKLAKVHLDYTDYYGVQKQIVITTGIGETSIYKFKPASKLKITTLVLPSDDALEYIPLESEYYDFPALYDPEMLDRSAFKNMAMSADAKQGHGGSVANLWDGNNETYLHTADGVGVPCHVTIDTGEENYLVSGRAVMRSIFTWCPFQFQVWGLPDVDDINTHEPSIADNLANKDAWEAESIAKGWVNLTDYGARNYATRERNNLEATFSLDKTKKVRYIRYRALKVWEREGDTGMNMEGDGAYFCTSELYLYKTAFVD